mmetsp:Transcript_81219/g.94690  ORF Transcript_81219/g.94690 Transcript_81219/m.94690 type:complete len:104 (-) Transcript_81219:318-629(-)
MPSCTFTAKRARHFCDSRSGGMAMEVAHKADTQLGVAFWPFQALRALRCSSRMGVGDGPRHGTIDASTSVGVGNVTKRQCDVTVCISTCHNLPRDSTNVSRMV